MKLEQIIRVNLLSDFQQIWIETEGTTGGMSKFYRLNDRCDINHKSQFKYHAKQFDWFDKASEYFVNS